MRILLFFVVFVFFFCFLCFFLCFFVFLFFVFFVFMFFFLLVFVFVSVSASVLCLVNFRSDLYLYPFCVLVPTARPTPTPTGEYSMPSALFLCSVTEYLPITHLTKERDNAQTQYRRLEFLLAGNCAHLKRRHRNTCCPRFSFQTILNSEKLPNG